MKNLGALCLTLLLALPAQAGGDSSDGHTHAAPAPVVSVPTAPRAAAATEEFEVVGILEGEQLRFYLDRAATNAPVLGAKVEIETGTLKVIATEVAPGIYAPPAAPFARPGKYPLTISVEAGDTADLLTATLEVGGPGGTPPAPVATSSRPTTLAVGLGLLGLLVVGAGIAVYRRFRKRKAGFERVPA